MHLDFCIIIPAIKKNAKIPDQLIKKLNGITLIQRAINIAKKIAHESHIFIITDSQEISLISERNNIACHYDRTLHMNSNEILKDLKFIFLDKSKSFKNIILYRASTPLVNERDITSAYKTFVEEDADLLVTFKKENHKIWKGKPARIESLFVDTDGSEVFIELKAFIIVKSDIFLGDISASKIIPYFLNDHGIEINNYQDWWICEKLLARKRILFVVSGYSEIGMGHIYRALTIAHEIDDHEIFFMCTKNSDIAISNITEKDYPTYVQTETLVNQVLTIRPDLVINDILDTDKDYILTLKQNNIKVVNFEDLGTGATQTDLTINEIFSSPLFPGANILWGSEYFFLRDEFNDARINKYREVVDSVLITFGGTDPQNYTQKVLEQIAPICEEKDIKIYIVNGAGFMHRESLMTSLTDFAHLDIEYTQATSIISKVMESVDIAVSSNGRTIFELAHMHIPSLVLSQHERETTHSFTCEDNGFIPLGVIEKKNNEQLIRKWFTRIVEDNSFRKNLYDNMIKHDFLKNKRMVIKKILKLLNN